MGLSQADFASERPRRFALYGTCQDEPHLIVLFAALDSAALSQLFAGLMEA